MQPAAKHPGELCLDFANTLRWHASDQPKETLHNYEDLLAWAHKAELLTTREVNELAREARSRAADSKHVFERGVELREVIYRIIVANIEIRPPTPDDLERLNREFDLAHHYWKVAPTENGYQLTWTKDKSYLDRPLWHITRSAVDLLLAAEVLPRVGQCADDRGCGWLFIDWSKNHSRRWCDINDCGNRAKQRRFYQRSHKHGA